MFLNLQSMNSARLSVSVHVLLCGNWPSGCLALQVGMSSNLHPLYVNDLINNNSMKWCFSILKVCFSNALTCKNFTNL